MKMRKKEREKWAQRRNNGNNRAAIAAAVKNELPIFQRFDAF